MQEHKMLSCSIMLLTYYALKKKKQKYDCLYVHKGDQFVVQ